MSLVTIPMRWNCERHGAMGQDKNGCSDCLVEQIADLRAALKPSHLGEPTWRVGTRASDEGVRVVVEGLIEKGDYDDLRARLAETQAVDYRHLADVLTQQCAALRDRARRLEEALREIAGHTAYACSVIARDALNPPSV